MGNIVLLDEHTINKIAAGEVVDRPASIVKELVENSVDAKASKITVEIRNGGISQIKITDNGTGFRSDDVEIAFERHATSKIRKEADLQTVKSMGFRGEALASIAAISKVCLITKNIDEDLGMKAIVEAGNVISVEPSAAVQGTMIEIRDVFYNVPARFKFLKKDSTEASYIEDVITRMALAHPEISFKYINNGKSIIQTSGKGDLKSTIYDIFGREIYNNIIPIEYETDNMKVQGVLGKQVISRSTRMHQFTFLNLRYIKDKIINTAIDKACMQKYAIGKFPFIVLNLTMNPANVDVNVHPSKLEVKFENESKIFDIVYHGIKNAIEQEDIKSSPFTTIRNTQIEDEMNKANSTVTAEIKKEKVETVDNIPFVEIPKSTLSETKSEEKIEPQIIKQEIAEEVFVPYVAELPKENIFNMETKKEDEVDVEAEEVVKRSDLDIKSSAGDDIVERFEKDYYTYIGHIFDTYIIIQVDDKIYMVDQHAAHERFLYEKIKKDYLSKSVSVQMLLLPLVVELTEKEKKIVDENIELFKNTGFEIEEFGERSFKISGVPNIGYEGDYKTVFMDMIDELLGASTTYSTSREQRFIATLACKAAIKGNTKISKEEQIKLIDDMIKLDNPFNCPHGRPTAVSMRKYEIERKFLRK